MSNDTGTLCKWVKHGEKIVIGEVEILVERTKGDQVRLIIKAPKKIKVEEVA